MSTIRKIFGGGIFASLGYVFYQLFNDEDPSTNDETN